MVIGKGKPKKGRSLKGGVYLDLGGRRKNFFGWFDFQGDFWLPIGTYFKGFFRKIGKRF